MPPVYNTGYGYAGDINAATCERIVPIAESLGVKIFVIDDGWETNVPPDSGKYGDWVVDRRPDKFPLGLRPISALVREHNMRFGLWTAPIMVDERSQAATLRPEWLIRHADGSRAKLWDKYVGMCFTSGWEENYSSAMQLLCRDLTVTYLKLDSGLFEDDCVTLTHAHPVGHSVAVQGDNWRDFCDKSARGYSGLHRGSRLGHQSGVHRDQRRRLSQGTGRPATMRNMRRDRALVV